jgi:hypothetical protein
LGFNNKVVPVLRGRPSFSGQQMLAADEITLLHETFVHTSPLWAQLAAKSGQSNR